jgi:hypothetical protein
MKNKNLYLIFLLIAIFSSINAAYCQPMTDDRRCPEAIQNENWGIRDAYRYVSLGVGPIVFIPHIGLGYRTRYSQFGWDASLGFSTIGYAHQLSTHLIGHYYLNPFKQNSTYLGLGLLGSAVFTNDKGCGGTLSPDFVIGKELERKGNSRHFIEMHVATPTMCLNTKHSMYFPLMYIKYGISF